MSGQEFSLLDLFREEVRSHTGTLSQGLVELEAEPANPQKIEPLMRAAHSIKGAARIVGLDAAVGLAHAMEDALVAAQNGRITLSAADIDVLLRGTDVLAELGPLDDEAMQQWGLSRKDELAELNASFEAMAHGRPAALAVSEPPRPMPVGPPVVLPEVTQAGAPLPALTGPGSPSEQVEAVVRVTAESLNRLLNLAGESLVQARWLQPFATTLLKLKKHQDHLAAQINAIASAYSGRGDMDDRLLNETIQQSALCRQLLAECTGAFEEHAACAEDLNSRLYREVIVSRMRPFSDGAQGLPRLVRDMARKLGKEVRLEIQGQATEVDRDILEKLEAPLTHLIRNAVDHGVESPQTRRSHNKPEQATVRIEVRHRAGMLAITVSDDGSGIDIETLRKKVVERGLTSSDMAGNLTDAELLEFLFLPGFSTARELTEFSGRGVGLDVVQTTIRKVGGSVRVTTRPGVGTSFHMQLPITLSVLRAVLVEIAGEVYAFPHNRIDRLIRIPRQSIRSLEHRQYVSVDGNNVGLVLAAQILELSADPPPGDELPVLLMSDDSGHYGLIVEAFRGEQDLVVRPLDPRLGKVPNVSAAAILDDGCPVLIADVEDMIRSMDHFIQSGTLRRCDEPEQIHERRKRILVVDDSVTVREVERQLLLNAGYDVDVAVDGKDGWNQLRAGQYDLVVTDVDMPRMNGLDLIKAIRDHDSLRHLPIIIVSYKDREEDRLRGLEVGANFYLTKSSFHDNTFLRACADLL